MVRHPGRFVYVLSCVLIRLVFRTQVVVVTGQHPAWSGAAAASHAGVYLLRL